MSDQDLINLYKNAMEPDGSIEKTIFKSSEQVFFAPATLKLSDDTFNNKHKNYPKINIDTVAKFGDLHIYEIIDGSAEFIDRVGRKNVDTKTIQQSISDKDDVYQVGIRLPHYAGGWNYDIHGNSPLDSEQELLDQSKWLVGALDLRWNEDRKFWQPFYPDFYVDRLTGFTGTISNTLKGIPSTVIQTNNGIRQSIKKGTVSKTAKNVTDPIQQSQVIVAPNAPPEVIKFNSSKVVGGDGLLTNWDRNGEGLVNWWWWDQTRDLKRSLTKYKAVDTETDYVLPPEIASCPPREIEIPITGCPDICPPPHRDCTSPTLLTASIPGDQGFQGGHLTLQVYVDSDGSFCSWNLNNTLVRKFVGSDGADYSLVTPASGSTKSPYDIYDGECKYSRLNGYNYDVTATTNPTKRVTVRALYGLCPDQSSPCPAAEPILLNVGFDAAGSINSDLTSVSPAADLLGGVNVDTIDGAILLDAPSGNRINFQLSNYITIKGDCTTPITGPDYIVVSAADATDINQESAVIQAHRMYSNVEGNTWTGSYGGGSIPFSTFHSLSSIGLHKDVAENLAPASGTSWNYRSGFSLTVPAGTASPQADTSSSLTLLNAATVAYHMWGARRDDPGFPSTNRQESQSFFMSYVIPKTLDVTHLTHVIWGNRSSDNLPQKLFKIDLNAGTGFYTITPLGAMLDVSGSSIYGSVGSLTGPIGDVLGKEVRIQWDDTVKMLVIAVNGTIRLKLGSVATGVQSTQASLVTGFTSIGLAVDDHDPTPNSTPSTYSIRVFEELRVGGYLTDIATTTTSQPRSRSIPSTTRIDTLADGNNTFSYANRPLIRCCKKPPQVNFSSFAFPGQQVNKTSSTDFTFSIDLDKPIDPGVIYEININGGGFTSISPSSANDFGTAERKNFTIPHGSFNFGANSVIYRTRAQDSTSNQISWESLTETVTGI